MGPGHRIGFTRTCRDVLLLQNGSRIVARAFEGRGGNIDLTTRALLVAPDSEINASSQLGVDGVVRVNAPQSELGAHLPRLSEAFLDASVLRKRCAELEQSSLRFASRGVEAAPDAMRAAFPGELHAARVAARQGAAAACR